jgi:SAM-dependent methyltransferase
VDRIADFYAGRPEMSRPGPGAADRIAKSLRLLSRTRPETVLDVGCGDGSIAVSIKESTGARVLGVDVSAASVAAAIDQGVEGLVCEVGIDPLPIADGSIDLVYMGEVIEHLLDPDAALDDVHRVLAARGYLLMSTPNLACLLNRIALAMGAQPFFTEVSTRRVLGRHFAAFGQGAEPVGHLRIATLGSLRELLDLHGFVVEDAVGATFLKTRAFRALESLTCRPTSFASILVVLARKRA